MAEKITLVEIDIDVDLAVKDSQRLKEEIELLKAQAKLAKDEQGELSEEYIKYSASLKTAQKELRVNTKLTEDAIQADLAKDGSVEQLRKQLSVVSVQWAKLSKEERENTTEGQKLTAQKLELTESLKDEESATGDARRNVGNYGDALEDLDGITGGVIGQVKALGKQFLKLASNPIVLLITAIVGSLALLINSFKKSQEGADTFAKAFDAINAVIDSVVGRLAGLAGNIKDLITGKKSFAEFKKEASGTFKGIQSEIKKTVEESNRLFDLKTGLEEATIAATTYVEELNMVAETQGAIADDATLSFQEREEAARLAEEAEIEARTVELELAEKNLEVIQTENNLKKDQGLLTRELRQQEADLIAAVTQAETTLAVTRIDQSKRRAELAQDNFEQELDFLLDIADNTKTINEKKIADETRAFDERVRILGETRELINESFDQQIALFEAENEINIERDKLLTLNNEQIFEYARGLELSEIETNRLKEVIVERKTAQQDLVDIEKELNDERIANEQLEYFASKKIADDSWNEDIARLNSLQEAELQYLTDKQEAEKNNIFAVLDLQKEKLEIEKERELASAEAIGADTYLIRERYANAEAELDRAKFDTGLSLAGDFAGNIATLFGEQTKIGKAAAVAQITIQSAQAAMGAYASLAPIPFIGPILGAAAAAAAIAYGVSQIKDVYAVPDNPTDGGVSTPSSAPPSGGTGGAFNKDTGSFSANQDNIGGGIASRDIDQLQEDNEERIAVVVDDVTSKQFEQLESNLLAAL